MNIKSLLLGSAAALVGVSSANAADAIMAEPEPVDYVRICDAYGNGFFYIPGTETCLQLSGYVRMQVGYSKGANGFTTNTRGRLNFDARSETEWGTLRGFARVQGTTADNSSPDAIFDQAYLELGGIRMGFTESAWLVTQTGGASNWGGHTDHGGRYGYHQVQLASYSFAGNGAFGTLSLENDNYVDYKPDVVGVLGYGGGWGTIWAKAAYDSKVGTVATNGSGYAASIGAQFNIPNAPAGSSFRLIGFYSNNDNTFSVGSKYSVLASYNQVFNSQFSAALTGQYFHELHGIGGKGYETGLDLVWTPFGNNSFEVRAEGIYTYQKPANLASGSSYTGFLRFTRNF